MKRIEPLVAVAVIVIVAAAVVGIVWMTMDLAPYVVEACVTYRGRTNCATAAGQSREEAIDTAVRTACAMLASGVGPTIACGNTEPDSLRWIEEP